MVEGAESKIYTPHAELRSAEMRVFKPKFSQQTFDHMRRLIHRVKNRALTQNDSDTYGDADLLDALLAICRRLNYGRLDYRSFSRSTSVIR